MGTVKDFENTGYSFVAKKKKVHKIMLHTEKKLKAYDIYHHMGFENQDEESVYLTKWFM